MRLFGSQRRLSDSVGVALLAGGGPSLIAALAADATVILRIAWFGEYNQLFRGPPLWAALGFAALVCLPLIAFFVLLMLAMAGLHDLPRYRAVAAVSLSLIIVAVSLGGLHHVVKFSLGVPHATLWLYGHDLIPDIWF